METPISTYALAIVGLLVLALLFLAPRRPSKPRLVFPDFGKPCRYTVVIRNLKGTKPRVVRFLTHLLSEHKDYGVGKSFYEDVVEQDGSITLDWLDKDQLKVRLEIIGAFEQTLDNVEYEVYPSGDNKRMTDKEIGEFLQLQSLRDSGG